MTGIPEARGSAEISAEPRASGILNFFIAFYFENRYCPYMAIMPV
jgi:hypothetical protein